MKTIILLSILPFFGISQAHLGASYFEIKAKYPSKEFKIAYTNDGTKYMTADQPLGLFAYFFDSDNKLTNFCIQIPRDNQALNTQIEIYNKKYVVISEFEWKAYLEGGGIMKILLEYDKDMDNSIFKYTNN